MAGQRPCRRDWAPGLVESGSRRISPHPPDHTPAAGLANTDTKSTPSSDPGAGGQSAAAPQTGLQPGRNGAVSAWRVSETPPRPCLAPRPGAPKQLRSGSCRCCDSAGGGISGKPGRLQGHPCHAGSLGGAERTGGGAGGTAASPESVDFSPLPAPLGVAFHPLPWRHRASPASALTKQLCRHGGAPWPRGPRGGDAHAQKQQEQAASGPWLAGRCLPGPRDALDSPCAGLLEHALSCGFQSGPCARESAGCHAPIPARGQPRTARLRLRGQGAGSGAQGAAGQQVSLFPTAGRLLPRRQRSPSCWVSSLHPHLL